MNEYEISRLIAPYLEGRIIYDLRAGSWFVFDDPRWVPDSEAVRIRHLVRTEVEKMTEASPEGSAVQKALHAAQRPARIRAIAESLMTSAGFFARDIRWEAEPELFVCKSGVFNLRTGRRAHLDPPPKLLYMAEGDLLPLDEDARQMPLLDLAKTLTPLFAEFLDDVQPELPDVQEFLISWAGYCATGWTLQRKVLFLTGSGANGKSVYAAILRSVLGEYATDLRGDQILLSSHNDPGSPRADLISLRGRRLAVVDEPHGGRLDVGSIKLHAGGTDWISARRPYGIEPESWCPTHKLLIMTNRPPEIDDVGVSMQSRLLVVNFPRQFVGGDEDPNIRAKIVDAERDGLLTLFAEAARRYLNDGRLWIPESVEFAAQELLRENDPIADCLDDVFELDPLARLSSRDAYQAYEEWYLRTNPGTPKLTRKAFTLALKAHGCQTGRSTDGRSRIIFGIRRRTDTLGFDEGG